MDIDDINALIDDAKPTERSYSVCMRKDLVAEYEQLEVAFAAADTSVGGDSLAGNGSDARENAEKMAALTEQMRASTVPFTFRSLPRKEYKRLLDKHPPRLDEEGNIHRDDRIGINTRTFWEPLVRACLVSPVLDPARLTHVLDGVLSDAQFDGMAQVAFEVNRVDVDIPFSSAASKLLQGSKPE